MSASRIIQTPSFAKTVKKLHPKQKLDLDGAVRAISENPLVGEQKKGDLSFLRVYKFHMNKQLHLLGYQFEEATKTLVLMAVGVHENFYRDIG